MSRFRKGDRVRVKNPDPDVEIGTILTVSSGPDGQLDGGNYHFEEIAAAVLGGDLELIKEGGEMSEYKARDLIVGDKVRRIKDSYNSMRMGDVDTVMVVESGRITLEKHGWGHSPSSLELVTHEERTMHRRTFRLLKAMPTHKSRLAISRAV